MEARRELDALKQQREKFEREYAEQVQKEQAEKQERIDEVERQRLEAEERAAEAERKRQQALRDLHSAQEQVSSRKTSEEAGSAVPPKRNFAHIVFNPDSGIASLRTELVFT